MNQHEANYLYNRRPMACTAVDGRMNCGRVRCSGGYRARGDASLTWMDTGQPLLPTLSILVEESEVAL